jgi:PilZ domain
MIDNIQKTERRRFPRRQTNLAATVIIAGTPPIACTVRNISDGGALIVFENPVCVPYSFIVHIEGIGKPFGCEVRHHFGARVGVEFVDMMRVSPVATEMYGGEIGNWIEVEPPLPFG